MMRSLALLVVLGLGAACGAPADAHIPAIGDPERGRQLAREYGCQTCHVIPGIIDARGTVGPPLERFALRSFAGGRLNTPENLIEFLIDPRAVDPRTPMPVVGLHLDEARDIAAYLYTLR